MSKMLSLISNFQVNYYCKQQVTEPGFIPIKVIETGKQQVAGPGFIPIKVVIEINMNFQVLP